MVIASLTAAYPADRAASLAGVPQRTVYHWAHTKLIVPSVSHSRVMRWSFADLLVLRLVDWLRHEQDAESVRIPKTSISRIRAELSRAEHLGEHLMSDGVEVLVEPGGKLVFVGDDRMWINLGKGLTQERVNSRVNLVRPFESEDGQDRPDLVEPRPTLRIVPGKLSGEPHVRGTRVPTQDLASLKSRGLEVGDVLQLYPFLSEQNVGDAVDLEDQLRANLDAATAA